MILSNDNMTLDTIHQYLQERFRSLVGKVGYLDINAYRTVTGQYLSVNLLDNNNNDDLPCLRFTIGDKLFIDKSESLFIYIETTNFAQALTIALKVSDYLSVQDNFIYSPQVGIIPDTKIKNPGSEFLFNFIDEPRIAIRGEIYNFLNDISNTLTKHIGQTRKLNCELGQQMTKDNRRDYHWIKLLISGTKGDAWLKITDYGEFFSSLESTVQDEQTHWYFFSPHNMDCPDGVDWFYITLTLARLLTGNNLYGFPTLRL